MAWAHVSVSIQRIQPSCFHQFCAILCFFFLKTGIHGQKIALYQGVKTSKRGHNSPIDFIRDWSQLDRQMYARIPQTLLCRHICSQFLVFSWKVNGHCTGDYNYCFFSIWYRRFTLYCNLFIFCILFSASFCIYLSGSLIHKYTHVIFFLTSIRWYCASLQVDNSAPILFIYSTWCRCSYSVLAADIPVVLPAMSPCGGRSLVEGKSL